MEKNNYVKGRQEIASEYDNLCKTHKGNDKSLKTYSYKKACQIADANYDKTGEHIAVEDINAKIISFPSDH